LTNDSIGNGYIKGFRATGYEVVRKARKNYVCEGAMIDVDTASEGFEISPATGGAVFEGYSENCESEIASGALYVASNYVGDNAMELFDKYRYTFRTCLACATHYKVIDRSKE
jgi:hypothetical protein